MKCATAKVKLFNGIFIKERKKETKRIRLRGSITKRWLEEEF